MSVTLGMNQLEALEAAESLQRQRAKEVERERDMWKAATRHAEGERDEAITVLRKMIDRWAPHCGSCCVAVNGKATVTEASCVCDDLHKRARKLTKMPPLRCPGAGHSGPQPSLPLVCSQIRRQRYV